MTTTPRELPILFSAPLVRALLEGRKTVTRRVVKPQPPAPFAAPNDYSMWRRPSDGLVMPTGPVSRVREAMADAWPKAGIWRCPYGEPGDLLWVRETWRPAAMSAPFRGADGLAHIDVRYAADDRERCGIQHDADVVRRWCDQEDEEGQAFWDRWRPSIHMPKAAARIWLRVESVRVERVQDITDEDIAAEGVEPIVHHGHGINYRTPLSRLWDSINLKRGFGWDANPWVWVVRFSVASTTGKPA